MQYLISQRGINTLRHFAAGALGTLMLSGCVPPLLEQVLMNSQHGAMERECVVILHGLARSSKTMVQVQQRLERHNYTVINRDYPSRRFTIPALSAMIIPDRLRACREHNATRVHFVTHSMGGILVRHYLETHAIPGFGRFVMLAPPNQGSELIDVYRGSPGFRKVVGPAGEQLGTDEQSIPRQLGRVQVETGVISGTRSANPWLSLSLPNPDDGKISVRSTFLEGMCAHVMLPVSHRFMSRNEQVLTDIATFLSEGRFDSAQANYFDCIAGRPGNVSPTHCCAKRTWK